MGRALWWIALSVVIGVGTGLILHRVILGMFVGAGVLLLGILIAINRADPVDPEI